MKNKKLKTKRRFLSAALCLALSLTVMTVGASADHVHSYGEDWVSDDMNHWHECDCSEKNDEWEHTFEEILSDEAKRSDADCENAEVYYVSCSECGYVGTDIFVNGQAKGHSFTSYASDNNADCTDDGTKTAKCDNCDVIAIAVDEGSKTPHTFENGKCTACNAADPDANPQTGCRNGLWQLLLLVSGGAAITLCIMDKRKRSAE